MVARYGPVRSRVGLFLRGLEGTGFNGRFFLAASRPHCSSVPVLFRGACRGGGTGRTEGFRGWTGPEEGKKGGWKKRKKLDLGFWKLENLKTNKLAGGESPGACGSYDWLIDSFLEYPTGTRPVMKLSEPTKSEALQPLTLLSMRLNYLELRVPIKADVYPEI